MGLFSNIFGSEKKEQKAGTSPYLAPEKDPKELHFARVFTEKGGKFIFSENVEQTRNYFHQILAENGWGSADLKSDSKSLNSFFTGFKSGIYIDYCRKICYSRNQISSCTYIF